ncbi:MAG: prolyl oligopeptidase family serine peptidase [Deltaproteobacteria bacterium]|jgi:dienelactone hydrolase|nr:prolyl oligopeptidase family serine peptidase [Deltaproteobacteria bacterium]MBT6611878.1 prolyl oligopeptidase family serine peptidase [Deltaproteobacteria bacterium]MBT7152224.1 prolyl oligopeptidase family serine peptidase [Deltaproteobacteria bacterium]
MRISVPSGFDFTLSNKKLTAIRTFVGVITTVLTLSACSIGKPVMKSTAQVHAELEPGYHIFKPKGDPPYPTIMMLHGASDTAWFAVYEGWAKDFQSEGYAVVAVDSYHSRGIGGRNLRSGTLLPGERAADILVTLDWMKRQSWIKQDAIAAVGWSHGGGTILDGLVLNPPKRRPTGLIDLPESTMMDLKAVVLFYPGCLDKVMGIELMKVIENDWEETPPMLAFLPRHDEVANMKLCARILDRHLAKGHPITYNWVNGGHSFDQATDDYGQPFSTSDAKLKKQTWDQMFEFLDKQLKKN